MYAKGNFLEAETWYRKSLESKPDHLQAFLALAKLLSPDRTVEAEDLYKKAFKLDGDSPDVYIHYGKYFVFGCSVHYRTTVQKRFSLLAGEKGKQRQN